MTTDPTDPTVRPQPTEIDLARIETGHPEGETVLQRVAVAAAETVAATTGVHRLGSPLARVVGRARHAVSASSTEAPGIRVDDIDGAIVVSIDVVLEYPHPMTDVAEVIRTQVTSAIAQITDARATVDVRVIDVHGPFDPATDDEADAASTAPVAGGRPGLSPADTPVAAPVDAPAPVATPAPAPAPAEPQTPTAP